MSSQELKKHLIDILKAAAAAGLIAFLTEVLNKLTGMTVQEYKEVGAQVAAGVVAIKRWKTFS